MNAHTQPETAALTRAAAAEHALVRDVREAYDSTYTLGRTMYLAPIVREAIIAHRAVRIVAVERNAQNIIVDIQVVPANAPPQQGARRWVAMDQLWADAHDAYIAHQHAALSRVLKQDRATRRNSRSYAKRRAELDKARTSAHAELKKLGIAL